MCVYIYIYTFMYLLLLFALLVRRLRGLAVGLVKLAQVL